MSSNNAYFGLLAVVRDKYINDINSAKKQRKERKKIMDENLRSGSPAYLKEQTSIFDDYRKATSKARSSALEEIQKGYDAAIEKEKAKIRTLAESAVTIRALENLRGLPVSAAEFRELCEMFGGRSLWSDKLLKQIGEQNGINTAGLIEPGYSEKVEVLTALRDRYAEKIREFNFENEDIDLLAVSLSDPALRIAEEQFSGGYVNYDFTAERRARALLDECAKENNPYLIAGKVNNLLETSDIKTAAEIVKIIEGSEGFWSNIATMGGLSRGMDAFKAREKAYYGSLADECASLDLVAEVARLSPTQKAVAKEHSNSNKITASGLEYLKTDEGKAELRELKGIERELKDSAAEAEERAEIEREQAHINSILQ